MTIRDVARQAGVSVGTVSRVLNDHPGVRPDLRERVRSVIAETGYRPNLVARALQTRRTHTLAFLVPSIANPFFGSVLRSVERTAHGRGYSVFVGNTDGDPEKVARYRERLLAMGIDGVLAALSWDVVSGGLLPALAQQGVPVVGVSGSRIVEGVDCFVPDDVGGGEMAGRYLLGLGHRDIAFIGAVDSRTTDLRYEGLRGALAAAGVEHDPARLVRVGGYREADAAQAVQELLTGGAPFTAVVAFNDIMALGALNALEEQGLTVPGRVSLIGFDDTVSAYARPKITTVACPKEELGTRGVERLLARIGGDTGVPRVTPLPMHLVVRASTRAVE